MANIKINGVTPSAFYVGDTAATAVYYGSTQLWSATPSPGPSPTFPVTSTGVYSYNFTDNSYAYKAQRITVPANVNLSSSASFVWSATNSSTLSYFTNSEVNRGKCYLILSNPSDPTKYVIGTQNQPSNGWQSAGANYYMMMVPVTWSGTLSGIFNWGNLTWDDLRDSSGNIDVWVCNNSGIYGSKLTGGDAPGGYLNTPFLYDDYGDNYGDVITVNVT